MQELCAVVRICWTSSFQSCTSGFLRSLDFPEGILNSRRVNPSVSPTWHNKSYDDALGSFERIDCLCGTPRWNTQKIRERRMVERISINSSCPDSGSFSKKLTFKCESAASSYHPWWSAPDSVVIRNWACCRILTWMRPGSVISGTCSTTHPSLTH